MTNDSLRGFEATVTHHIGDFEFKFTHGLSYTKVSHNNWTITLGRDEDGRDWCVEMLNACCEEGQFDVGLGADRYIRFQIICKGTIGAFIV